MTKEVVKHRKDEKKKATMTPKEKKAKKQEKKQTKQLNLIDRASSPITVAWTLVRVCLNGALVRSCEALGS